MTTTVYVAFTIGMAIGLEFGFRWGQRYMFNKIVRAVEWGVRNDGKALERKEDEPYQEPKVTPLQGGEDGGAGKEG